MQETTATLQYIQHVESRRYDSFGRSPQKAGLSVNPELTNGHKDWPNPEFGKPRTTLEFQPKDFWVILVGI